MSYKCTRWSGWVHAKWPGILNSAQYRGKCDWTCDTCSAPSYQQSPPPTLSPAPHTEQIRNDSTLNVLQLYANGIGNQLTELGVVLKRNKVKVAVIQESKLSPKSKNPASGTTPRCVRIVPMARRRIADLHSQIDNLQTAIVTRFAIPTWKNFL